MKGSLPMEEEKNNSILKTESKEETYSPGKLNEYIRIGSAGGYVMIAALILLVAAIIIWGFAGKIPVTLTEYGVVSGPRKETKMCVCFVDVNKNTGMIPEGNEVNVRMADGKTVKGHVQYMSQYPESSDEVRDSYGNDDPNTTVNFDEWMLEKLLENSTYSYYLTIETDEDISEYWHQVVDVTIIINEVRPISFLVN